MCSHKTVSHCRYLDDRFLYGINASALNRTGAIIPEEPMYLLLNTAVSSTWGFPMPCPEGCACDCFDPRLPECQCAVPPGILDTLPASFALDYVRVYQAVGYVCVLSVLSVCFVCVRLLTH